jgi:predicted dithiol-disulfide oxidoreductase (DUF899 family)
MDAPRIATREDWLAERLALLAREKALNRARDELAAARRALPWVRIDKPYRFEGAGGPLGLADLFAGRSQLALYHFMFGPDWQEGCPSCSFWADGYDGMAVHLAARDVTLAAASRAPLAKLLAYRDRMGWRFPWVSALGSDFNADFGVTLPEAGGTYNYAPTRRTGEMPGLSVFVRDGDAVFHTYSTYARGLDPLNSAYQILDLTPKGRDEAGLPWPMAWVRRHDRYGT